MTKVKKSSDVHPVMYHSSSMMSIDEIKKALPGKHKETFETEMNSALFKYDGFLGSIIYVVLNKVWSKMNNNEKEHFLSKMKMNVLEEIRKGYLYPYSRNPNYNRANLIRLLTVEKHVKAAAKNEEKQKEMRKSLMANMQAISTSSRVKEIEKARIRTFLMSMRKIYPADMALRNAMSTMEAGIRAAAKNEENHKRINNTRKKLLDNFQKEFYDLRHPYTKQGERLIQGTRNSNGAYYPRNKNAVPAGKEAKWRDKR
jgi:hypothetical protein